MDVVIVPAIPRYEGHLFMFVDSANPSYSRVARKEGTLKGGGALLGWIKVQREARDES